MLTILSVEDHGTWRGHRTWTVRVQDEDGSTSQVSVRDVTTEASAKAEALTTFANRRRFTPEEREAMQQTNAALGRALR